MVDDHHYRKCGQILYNVDEEVFMLNCFFCSKTCLDLRTFTEHVKKQHSNLMKKNEDSPGAVTDVKSINVSMYIPFSQTKSNLS